MTDPRELSQRLSREVVTAVEARREALGWSRSELARRLDTSPAYVTKILNGGANFTLASLARLAATLGLGLDLRLAPGADTAAERPAKGAAGGAPQAAPVAREPEGEEAGGAPGTGRRPAQSRDDWRVW